MTFVNNLLAKMHQAAQIIAAFAAVYATLLVAFAALYGLGFTVTWAAMFLENTATLHAPATFTDHRFFTTILNWQPVETMAFWTLPVKLQGLIIVFLGATSFYVASYAADWLYALTRTYPFWHVTNTSVIHINKWLQLINTARQLWCSVINFLRKIALYIMVTMASTAIVYVVWHILSAKCPM